MFYFLSSCDALHHWLTLLFLWLSKACIRIVFNVMPCHISHSFGLQRGTSLMMARRACSLESMKPVRWVIKTMCKCSWDLWFASQGGLFEQICAKKTHICAKFTQKMCIYAIMICHSVLLICSNFTHKMHICATVIGDCELSICFIQVLTIDLEWYHK